LNRINVDTDQIIPKQFLKRIERTGFGEFLFYDWRFFGDGTPRPDFELNMPRYKGSTILLAGSNFGCGSSREHAPWSLMDYGFRAVIAPSFADIFYNNCFKNGLLPIVLDEVDVRELVGVAEQSPGFQLTVDLESCQVYSDAGSSFSFEVDAFRRKCLLEGLDEISLTLQQNEAILRFERQRRDFHEPTD
jgi:3-isopropylmalate/(R)-2-methylmalate dehydratase small subunit